MYYKSKDCEYKKIKILLIESLHKHECICIAFTLRNSLSDLKRNSYNLQGLLKLGEIYNERERVKERVDGGGRERDGEKMQEGIERDVYWGMEKKE